jgi:hypothetical protein
MTAPRIIASASSFPILARNANPANNRLIRPAGEPSLLVGIGYVAGMFVLLALFAAGYGS